MRSSKRGLIIASIVALVAAVGGFFLLGIPGALVMEISWAFLHLLGYAKPVSGGDSWEWGMALEITALWPIAIVGGYAIAFHKNIKWSSFRRWLLFVCILFFWGVFLTFALLPSGVSRG